MAITLNDNLKINAPKPIDDRLLNGTVAYTDVAEANAATVGRRHQYLTLIVDGDEYWYRHGVADEDLVLKSTGNSGTNGTSYDFTNGLIETEGTVSLGGNIDTNITFTGGDKTILFDLSNGSNSSELRITDYGVLVTTANGSASNTFEIDNGVLFNPTYNSDQAYFNLSYSSLSLSITSSTGNYSEYLSPYGFSYSYTAGDDGSNLYGNAYYSYMSNANGSKFFKLELNGSTNNAVFTDEGGTQKGLQYADDYSPWYTDRSLVDKAYVDLAISTGGGSSYTFENGLSESSGSVTLGGNFAHDIYLLNPSSTNTFTIDFAYLVSSDTASSFSLTNSQLSYLNYDGASEIYSDFKIIDRELNFKTFSTGSPDPQIELSIRNDRFLVTDNRTTSTGVEYAADYSAHYTDRSLVDKAYVNTAVASNRYSEVITGDDATTEFIISHNFGTRAVVVQIINNDTPYDTIEADVQRTTTDSITVGFGSAPSSEQSYMVLILR